MKFLLLVVLFYALFWLVRRTLRQAVSRTARPPKPTAAADAEPEPMLRCLECGLHLPKREALAGRGGEVFCSEPHRVAYEEAHPAAR